MHSRAWWERRGVPARSTATVAVGAYVIIALGWFVFGVAPFLALVVIGYALYRNVSAGWYPIIATLWVVVGVAVSFIRNAATRRAGERLMEVEGLAGETGSHTGGGHG